MIIVIAATRLLSEGSLMNERTNTIDQRESEHESTYALLIRSEEKSRNLFEVVIYPFLILGPIIATWQFAQQPLNIPVAGWRAWVVSDAPMQNHLSREFQRLGQPAEIKG